MKNFNKYISESLLDDEEDLIKKSHKSVIISKISSLYNRMVNTDPYVDTYGRKLEVGDLVIYHEAASMEIGIIERFEDGGDYAIINQGKNRNRREFCLELMKIPNDKIFTELIK